MPSTHSGEVLVTHSCPFAVEHHILQVMAHAVPEELPLDCLGL